MKNSVCTTAATVIALVSLALLGGCADTSVAPDPGPLPISDLAGTWDYAAFEAFDAETDTLLLSVPADLFGREETLVVEADGRYDLDGTYTFTVTDSATGDIDTLVVNYEEQGNMDILEGKMIIVPDDPDESRFSFEEFTFYRAEAAGDELSIKSYFPIFTDIDLDGTFEEVIISDVYEKR